MASVHYPDAGKSSLQIFGDCAYIVYKGLRDDPKFAPYFRSSLLGITAQHLAQSAPDPSPPEQKKMSAGPPVFSKKSVVLLPSQNSPQVNYSVTAETRPERGLSSELPISGNGVTLQETALSRQISQTSPDSVDQWIIKESGKCYRCQICDKTFTRSVATRHHIFFHTGWFPFYCKTCRRGFATGYDLKIHERRHLGSRPFECSQCPKTFVTGNDLHNHEKRVHVGFEKSGQC